MKAVKLSSFIYLLLIAVITYFLSKIFGKDKSIKTPSELQETNTIYNTQLHPLSYSSYVQYTLNLSDAISGLGTDVDTIEDIFTSITPHELQLVNDIYNKSHDETLAQALRGELGLFNGDLIDLITALFNEAGLTY